MPINKNQDIPNEVGRFISVLIPKYFKKSNVGVVYHYTSISAALNILDSNMLFISNVQNMEDTFEIKYSISLLKNVLGIIKFHKDINWHQSLYKFIHENFVNNVNNYLSRMFLFSSTMEENKYIYNKYYSGKDCVCLQIDNDHLKSKISDKIFYLHENGTKFTQYSMFFGDVLYDSKKQQMLLKHVLRRYSEYIIEAIKRNGLSDNAYLRSMRIFIILFLCLFKSEVYQPENEYRMIIVPDKVFSNIQKRKINHRSINYIELILNDFNFIKSVKIFPGQEKMNEKLIRAYNKKGVKYIEV